MSEKEFTERVQDDKDFFSKRAENFRQVKSNQRLVSGQISMDSQQTGDSDFHLY